MATLATVKRETGGWKWPLVMAGYLFGLAYLASLHHLRADALAASLAKTSGCGACDSCGSCGSAKTGQAATDAPPSAAR
jgi:hypothetical protein